MSDQMQAMRIAAFGLALAMLPGGGIARAGIETFDGTGLTNVWVETGSFTGQQEIVWTYAHASGAPTVFTNNPSITLQTGFSTNKGWVRSETITGGCARISAAFKQVLAATSDCVVLVNGIQIANYKSSGGAGSVEDVSFEALDFENRMPFTNEFTLMVSNRLASGGRMALDNLAWEPFRLHVRLDRTGTNAAYAGGDGEFDVAAEVFDIGQAWTGGWSVAPEFAGSMTPANELALTLHPAAGDIGKIFELTYAATDPDGTGTTCQARCWMEVLEAPNPRFVDFETAAFAYNTNSGTTTNLNGMDWKFYNVQTSDATDTRIGTTSARFRHSSSAAPAYMESLETFEGVGEVSVHAAYYQSNRVVTFEVQTKGEGEAETWSTNGTFGVEGYGDITTGVFRFEVQRSEPVYVKLITTGNSGQRANLDDLRVSAYGDVPPRLVRSGETNAPVGRETVLDFELRNAEFVARDWARSLTPVNSNAVFEVTADDQLRLRFSPAGTNEWGDYAVAVTARIDGAVAGATNLAIRVVSAPAFDLAATATNLAVPGIVDVRVSNMVLHGSGTEWTTAWIVQPPFAHVHSLSNRSQYRIGTGTTEADAGEHTVTAVATDSGTGVTTTRSVVLTVTGSGGVENEVYPILSFDLADHLVVSGKAGRVYLPFGTTNLTMGAEETHWFWQGPPVTNTDGAEVTLAISNTPHPRLFFYGVKVRAAP